MPDYSYHPPSGVYLARVREVREGTTKDGAPRWAIAFEVASGPRVGQLLAWDALVFSPRGMARARRILTALRRSELLTPERTINGSADQLVGATAKVRVRLHTFASSVEGESITRSEIPYDGVWRDDEPTVSLGEESDV